MAKLFLVLLGISIGGFQIGSFFAFYNTLVDGITEQAITTLFYIVFLPLTLIIGTELIRCLISVNNKYLLYPLFIIFPIGLLSNLALRQESDMYQNIWFGLVVSVPILGLLFTTYLCMVKQSKFLCLTLHIVLVIGLGIPFSILGLPDHFISNSVQKLFISLIIGSTGFLALVLLLKTIRFMIASKKKKLCQISSNYLELGHWFNTRSFIFGEGLLSYIALNYQVSSDIKLGFTVACGFSLLLLFIVVNLILALRPHIPQGDQDSTYFDYIFGKAFQDLSERDEVARRKDTVRQTRLSIAIIFIVLLGIPATFITLGLSLFDNEAARNAFTFSGMLSGIIGVIGVIAIEIKKKLGPYSRNGLPICLSMVWIFVALPFCTMLPVATILTSHQDGSVQILVTASLLLMAFILLIGTSFLSSILNQVFRRIEHELKAKLAIIRLFQSLKTVAVKGEPFPLRLCVDKYIEEGRVSLINSLVSDNLVMAWPLGPRDPDPNISKVIITKELYKRAEMRKAKDQKQVDLREIKLEEKFQKEVDKRKKYKIKQKFKLQRLKQSMHRRMQRLSTLKNKQREAKDKLRRSLTGQMTQKSFTLSPSPRKSQRESISFEQDLSRSFSSKFFKKRSIAPGEREYSAIREQQYENNDGMNVASDQEESKELEEERIARVSMNYRVVRSRAKSTEDKLVAVFEIISEQPSLDALKQLIKISPKTLDALEEEIFAYFDNQEEQAKDQIGNGTRFDELFKNLSIRKQNRPSLNGRSITVVQFKEAIHLQSRKEYPTLGRSKAKEIYFTDLILNRLDYFYPEFISLPLLLYLLNLIKKQVEEIRERRIQLQIEGNEQKSEIKKMTRCQRGKQQCRQRNKRCVICVRSAFQWLMVKIIICCCFTGTDSKHKEIDSKEFSEEITQQEIQSLRPSQKKKQKNIEHKTSPEWHQLQDLIVQEIEHAVHLYDPKKRLPWRCTPSNTIMLIVKLLQFFSFLAFMWSSDIEWDISNQAQTSLVVINGDTAPEYNLYFYFYGLSLTLALFYTFLVRPAAIKARKGTLGMRKNGLPAKCFTRPFLFSKTVQMLSASFYTFILKNLLDVFSCDFLQQPVNLQRAHNIECFSNTHFGLMGGALVGILAYYPFATFLYSNLQFMNKDTDLKYDPQFMVYLAQAKLIFASLTSFLHSSNNAVIFRLALMAGTILFLAIQSARTSPCLVQSANQFFTAGYFSIFHLILTTILQVQKVQFSIVGGVMAGGIVIIWMITFALACKRKPKRNLRVYESSQDLQL